MQVASDNNAVEVSVVIPTRNRPQFVVQAVKSALKQNFSGTMEVIVIIDGDDPSTYAALQDISDVRLRVVTLAANVGGAEARNVGVRAAFGRWVAFLDDDDEWFPGKLSAQIEAAQRCTAKYPVVSSRLIARAPSSDCIRPLRALNPARPVNEYLFCRSSFADGPFALQTSTLLAPRTLLLGVPFRAGLPRHQDWDWVLRTGCMAGVQFLVIDSPLTIYRVEDARLSTGRALDWRFSFEWGATVCGRMTPCAYGWFLASECASRAAKSSAPLSARFCIAQKYLSHAGFSPRSAGMLVFFLFVPCFVRQIFHANIRVRRAREAHKVGIPPTRRDIQIEA